MADPAASRDLSSTLLTIGQNIVTAINNLATAFAGPSPKLNGNITLAAAATTVVAQAGVKAGALVLLIPTNAAAGTLMGSAKALYISATTPGVGFTVATASGVAVGTETFSYLVFNIN